MGLGQTAAIKKIAVEHSQMACFSIMPVFPPSAARKTPRGPLKILNTPKPISDASSRGRKRPNKKKPQKKTVAGAAVTSASKKSGFPLGAIQ
jgi:hypothetical protein